MEFGCHCAIRSNQSRLPMHREALLAVVFEPDDGQPHVCWVDVQCSRLREELVGQSLGSTVGKIC